MLIWILAEDKAEKCTKVKELLWSKAQVRDNLRLELEYHKRNGVKAKAIKFKPGV